jgi:hypothetical protein
MCFSQSGTLDDDSRLLQDARSNGEGAAFTVPKRMRSTRSSRGVTEAQAQWDDRNRNRLITAAEAWLFLASQLRRLEASFDPKRRSRRTTAWWIEPSGP